MTANERFKNQFRTVRWAAAILAVAAHAAVLFLTPAFRVDFGKVNASGPRMLLTLRVWQAPSCGSACPPGYVMYDTAMTQPRLINGPALNGRIPEQYPPLMWRHREPSSATFDVAVSKSGRVRTAILLQSSENGGDETLLQLVRLMRFEPPPSPLIAQFEVAIEPPHPQ